MKFETVTLYFNRHCPRRCPQCDIADGSRDPMDGESWKKIIRILQKCFDVKFFLFLGVEPLLMKEHLVEIVKWFTKHDIFYAFYTTSPEPLFTRYRQKLVDAGLNNWSSGIDGLPGEVEMDKENYKKAVQSLIGLRWMNERGVHTHTNTTIHKGNLHHIIPLFEYLQKEIPGCQSSANFIEWDREGTFDFFAPKWKMKEMMWDNTPEEKEEVRDVMAQIDKLSRVHGMRIQMPDSYLREAPVQYNKLTKHCGGVIGLAVDADGALRLCGYNIGERSPKWNIFQLEDKEMLKRFEEDWIKDLNDCSGCFWICQDMQEPENIPILDHKSGYYEKRWSMSPEQYELERTKIDG